MTDERPIKPKQDGRLTIKLLPLDDTPRPPIVVSYSNPQLMKTEESNVGITIYYRARRLTIPWHRISEVEITYNSDEYNKLLEQWVELDHPNHVEKPDYDCSMCLEKHNSDHHPLFAQFGIDPHAGL